MAENILIAEFKKGSSGEILKVTIGEFRNNYYLDFRCWYFPDGSETMHPTKKGINLHVEQIDELLKAIQAASAYVRKMYSSKVADSGQDSDSVDK